VHVPPRHAGTGRLPPNDTGLVPRLRRSDRLGLIPSPAECV
jgi:hypothetical protein